MTPYFETFCRVENWLTHRWQPSLLAGNCPQHQVCSPAPVALAVEPPARQRFSASTLAAPWFRRWTYPSLQFDHSKSSVDLFLWGKTHRQTLVTLVSSGHSKPRLATKKDEKTELPLGPSLGPKVRVTRSDGTGRLAPPGGGSTSVIQWFPVVLQFNMW